MKLPQSGTLVVKPRVVAGRKPLPADFAVQVMHEPTPEQRRASHTPGIHDVDGPYQGSSSQTPPCQDGVGRRELAPGRYLVYATRQRSPDGLAARCRPGGTICGLIPRRGADRGWTCPAGWSATSRSGRAGPPPSTCVAGLRRGDRPGRAAGGDTAGNLEVVVDTPGPLRNQCGPLPAFDALLHTDLPSSSQTFTAPDGTFWLDGLLPGTYRLAVRQSMEETAPTRSGEVVVRSGETVAVDDLRID